MTGLGPVNEGEPVKPMPDARPTARVEPDDAALDELRKAFGVPTSRPSPAGRRRRHRSGDRRHDSSPVELDRSPTGAAGRAVAAEPAADAEPPTPRRAAARAGTSGSCASTTTPASLAEPIRLIAGAPGSPVGRLIGRSGPKPAAPRDRHVIAIDDDDLPDAVYVEGSLDGDGTRIDRVHRGRRRRRRA